MPNVHLVCRPAEGGIRTHLAALLTDLPHSGWSASLHAPRELLSSLSLELKDTPGYALPISAKPTVLDLSVAERLANSLTRGAVVHAHGLRAAWIGLLAKRHKNIRLIVTLHNVPPKTIASNVLLKLIGYGCDRIICVSQHIAECIGTDKTIVIPNGVQCDDEPDRAKQRSEYATEMPADAFVVFCASRLSMEKGIDILVEAASMLPHVTVLIAGAGPMKAQLAKSSPANVRFLGHRKDIESLMQASNCIVVPSRSEGQGIAVLEAFAARTPVIAASVGGIPESISDGETGILIQPGNPQKLVNAIELMAADAEKAEAMATAAYFWVRENRRRQTQSAKVADVYNGLDPAD